MDPAQTVLFAIGQELAGVRPPGSLRGDHALSISPSALVVRAADGSLVAVTARVLSYKDPGGRMFRYVEDPANEA